MFTIFQNARGEIFLSFLASYMLNVHVIYRQARENMSIY